MLGIFLEYCSDFSSGIEWQRCFQFATNLKMVIHLKKNFIYLFTSKLLFQNCMMAASFKNGPLTSACVRLKKEIINIALEAGCEAITAVGTHQHTCSTVLCCYTFPEVQMSSFKCHYISAPINYWLSPLQHFEPSCGNGPHGSLPISSDQAEQKCPPPGFSTKKEGEVRFRGKEGQSRNKHWLHRAQPAH